MKYEIEVYKGQTIFYEDDYDKFTCDISVEDKYKSTKRQSLKDVRKEVDSFIKLNLDFKPFKIFDKQYDDCVDFNEIEIIGIRTDGRFISKRGDYVNQYGKRHIKDWMQFDANVKEQYLLAQKQYDDAYSKFNILKKELTKKLKPVDLSKYEHIINPE